MSSLLFAILERQRVDFRLLLGTMSTHPGPRARIRCSVRGCIINFARKADMVRHCEEVHGGRRYCLQPGCTYPGTKRRYRLRDHMAKWHPHLFNVSLNIPQTPRLGASTSHFLSQLDISGQTDPQALQSPIGGGNTGPPTLHNPPIQDTATMNNNFVINPFATNESLDTRRNPPLSQPPARLPLGNRPSQSSPRRENTDGGSNSTGNGEDEDFDEDFEGTGGGWNEERD